MMPFDAKFSSVHRSIKDACKAIGCSCIRGDEVWKEDAIIQDVVNLITESRVIICDLTNLNPNVLYEAGISHALGKKVILITQSEDHVPFDLRHVRFIKYLSNEQGLKEMSTQLQPKILDLISNP